MQTRSIEVHRYPVGGRCDLARPDASRRGERPAGDPARRHHRCRPDRPGRRRESRGAWHGLRRAGSRRRGCRRASGPGGTRGCSRRGSTWWIPRRAGCWRRATGSFPTPSALRPARSWSRSMSAPLAEVEEIASRIRLGVEVVGVTREGMDRTRTRGRAGTPFAVRVRTASGVVEDIAARAVIDASGTYLSPNSLSSSGLELLGMAEIADRVTPALPDVLGRDRAMFAGRHVTVVGAGHSAANTLLGLVELARQEPGTTRHVADSQRAGGSRFLVRRRRARRSCPPRQPSRPSGRRRPDHARRRFRDHPRPPNRRRGRARRTSARRGRRPRHRCGRERDRIPSRPGHAP